MTSIWDYPAGMSSRNLVGYDVEASDGHIGTIDRASNIVGKAHLIVETGSWILGKKRMIPAGVIQRIDDAAATVHVSLTKAQLAAAPDFDAARRNERTEHDRYYEPFLPEATQQQPARSMVTVHARP